MASRYLPCNQVDIPIWTSDADGAATTGRSMSRGQNKIVRIPPGESVVLNSAERAPFLLLIEVLVGELDFNPSTRGNKEVLKCLVLDEGKPAEKRSNSWPRISQWGGSRF